jgi:acetoin utilization protein AcuC
MFENIILPIGKEFNPQLIIRNGGSDPYFGDELTNLELTCDGLAMLGRQVRDLSDATCRKMLDLTVSGYGKWVTEGWMAIIKGSLKADKAKVEYGPQRKGFERLDEMQVDYKAKMVQTEIRRELGPYWKCLR